MFTFVKDLTTYVAGLNCVGYAGGHVVCERLREGFVELALWQRLVCDIPLSILSFWIGLETNSWITYFIVNAGVSEREPLV